VREVYIEIENYFFAIGEKTILSNVSMKVYRGEYLCIIGPNGAGKSTLLKCLMRILRGGRGTVKVNDRPLPDYGQQELARLISYVPQGDGRPMPFTVEEFVLMARYPHLSPFTTFTREDRQKAAEALALTGTAHLADRSVDTLSGGERQTVCIASAIAQGASLMLLDEPTTFLDPKHESDILALIGKVNREFGITVVCVTHDINSAVLQSDRIVSLKQGLVVFEGAAGEIMDNKVLENIYDKRFTFFRHPSAGTSIILPEAGRR
jgi:cobalamin transport system ATP-binding protein